ncbi:MAG: type VI secretion system tip protein VgrG [Acidobacteria bacterium]|nr:type VI secretion system tip protein VgrG [Acidobacteriota bacterium]
MAGTNLGKLRQRERPFNFHCPLGDDALLVTSFRGTEAMSENFQITIELISDDFNINFASLIGKTAALGIRLGDGASFRYIHGYLSKFRAIPHPGRHAYYEAEMVPWTWFLTLTSDCRIYQDKKVEDIIKDVFSRLGFRDYEFALVRSGNYGPWEYCTQYNETSYDFIRRLMKIEGMYFYFKHEKGKHTLVITDDVLHHKPTPKQDTFRKERFFGAALTGDDTIAGWDYQKQVVSNKFVQKEYHYDRPTQPLLANHPMPDRRGADRDLEVYHYPGQYEVQADGDLWAGLRSQEISQEHIVISGNSRARAMMPGYMFSLTEHQRREFNAKYLVTRVTHRGSDGAFVGGSDTEESSYANSFECLPSDVQPRMQNTSQNETEAGHERRAHSLVTAMVVGPQGEEIHTDHLGRVRVKFPWDRHGDGSKGDTSIWMRCMQQWCGTNYGQIWIPRVGDEVIVAFLHGDPDRPIVTGMVYNAIDMPPYKLPDNKTRSGIKTRSSKGKNPDKFNELRFEDKTGEEHVYIHAEKDLIIQVENEQMRIVDNNDDLKITNNQKTEIGATQSIMVKGASKEEVKGAKSVKVGGAFKEKSDGARSIQASSLTIKTTGNIVLEGTTISLKGGGGTLVLDASGATLMGTLVKINSGGMALPAMPDSPDAPDAPKGPEALKGQGYKP